MRKLLIGLAFSLAVASAHAEWVLVAETIDGDKTYADPATKRRTGNIVRIWEWNELSKPSVLNGKAFQSERKYTQYDCAERATNYLQATVFAGKMLTGETVGNINVPGDKIFIAPNTIGSALIDFACK
jgi:hypothetical protein